MNLAFRFWYNPKIINKENIPNDVPVIIACNHIHLFDQCLTIAATKRVIHYMAKKEYFEGSLRPFFEAFGCISVDREKTPDIKSVKSALRVLKKGGAIGIFPEGTRNRTNKLLLRFKPGTVALAKKADAYIVPCGLTGDYKFRSKNLCIRYGKPFKVSDMTVKEGNEKLYCEIEKLVLEGKESQIA
jgi:1-acyl-sn-glycerol-3-phosphate acyltransferase